MHYSPNFFTLGGFVQKYKKQIPFALVLFIAVTIVAASFVLLNTTQAATYTWDGGGGDNNWSTAANWSSDTVPTGGDTARFDGTSTKDVTIDTAVTVASIDINSGYSGTITQANTIAVTGTFSQDDGIFTGATQSINIDGTLDLNAGTFTATSGTMSLSGVILIESDVTFNHNNGTVVFDMSLTRNLGGTKSDLTFYDVEINGTGCIRPVSSDKTVENTLTLTNGCLATTSGGRMVAEGTVSHAATFDGGWGILGLNANIDIVATDGDEWPGIDLMHADSSFTAPGAATTVYLEGQSDIGAGTFTFGDGDVHIAGLDESGAGSASFGSGLLVAIDAQITTEAQSWDVDTTLTVNDLDLGGDMVVGTGDTIIVSGNFSVEQEGATSAGLGTGTIRLDGTVTADASGGIGGDGEGLIDINCACSFTNAGALPGITINHASGSVTTGTGIDINGPIDLQTGTLTLANGVSTDMKNDINIEPAATFNHGNGKIILDGDVVDYQSEQYFVTGDWTFYDLAIDHDWEVPWYFEAGSTTTVENSIVNEVYGSNQNFKIRSDTPGTQANFDFQSSFSIQDYRFQDINNTGAGTVTCIVRCVDLGNLTGNFNVDQAGVTVEQPAATTVSETGTTTTIAMRLDHRPDGDVVITATSGDTDEVMVSSPLTFTSSNYGTAQSFTLTGADDVLDDGPQEITISFAVTTAASDADYLSGFDIEDRTITVIDDDVPEGSFGFDVSANYSAEDVKATGDATATWLEFDHYVGISYLYTSDGGSTVDISSSKIRSGCVILLEGTDEYVITKIMDPTSGEIIISDDIDGIGIASVPDAGIAQTFIDGGSGYGDITSITCTGELDEAGGQLHESFISSRNTEDSGPSDYIGLYYDATTDAIYGENAWNSSQDFLQIAESDLDITTVDMNNPTHGQPAVDTTRNNIWWPDGGSSNSIWVVDMDTMLPAFGTVGASTFSNAKDVADAAYDATQDAIWYVTDDNPGEVVKLDASDGSTLVTTLIGDQSNFDAGGIVHDPTNNAIWVVIDDGESILKLDATDGDFYDSDLATSSYTLNISNVVQSERNSLYFDATDDYVVGFEMQGFQPTYLYTGGDEPTDFAFFVDASDGSFVRAEPLGHGVWGNYWFDPSTRELYANGDLSGNLEVLDMDTWKTKRYGSMGCATAVVKDSDGDVWGDDCYYQEIYEFVFDGTPAEQYYTIVTNDAGQMDVSSHSALSSVEVSDTLDSGTIYYAFSWDDRASFVVHNSPARVICSSLNADHGGTEGNWYYRDNASTWAASPSNTQEECLSLAVQQGTNNQMDSTDIDGLTDSDLEGGEGFNGGSTTTLDVAATFYSPDEKNSPSVQSMTFDFSAGTTVTTSPDTVVTSLEDIEILSSQTTTGYVDVLLSGKDIKDYLLSEDQNFTGAQWKVFEHNFGEIVSGLRHMKVQHKCSAGAGEKALYVKFRSETGNQSNTKKAQFTVDEQCRVGTVELVEDIETLLSNTNITFLKDDPEVPDAPYSGVVVLEGSDVNEYTLFEGRDFSRALWEDFPGADTGRVGSNGKAIYEVRVPYTFKYPADTVRLYGRMRSPSNDATDLYVVIVTFTEDGEVDVIEEPFTVKVPSNLDVDVEISGTSDDALGLKLIGSGIRDYRISTDRTFLNTNWKLFEGIATGILGPDKLPIEEFLVSFKLPPIVDRLADVSNDTFAVLTEDVGEEKTALVLEGSNIDEYLISEHPVFAGADWKVFEKNMPDAARGGDGKIVERMKVVIDRSPVVGTKVVYVKYRSHKKKHSAVKKVEYTIDADGEIMDVGEAEVVPIPPVNVHVTIDTEHEDTPEEPYSVVLTVDGTDIDDFAASDEPDFSDTTWENYDGEPTGLIGDSGAEVFRDEIPFTLDPPEDDAIAEDGTSTDTVYVVTRSPSEETSDVYPIDLTFDEEGDVTGAVALASITDEEPEIAEAPVEEGATQVLSVFTQYRDLNGEETAIYELQVIRSASGQILQVLDLNEEQTTALMRGCQDILREGPSDEEFATHMFGIAPPGQATPNGIPSDASQVKPGDFIRGVSAELTTVYCVTEDGGRRPFVTETDYFTHSRSFEQTRWVTDEALAAIPLSGPMLPKVGAALLTFESEDNVYLHDNHPEDKTRGLLYWITTEELARAMLGTSWADFVIDVSPALISRFDFGAPILTPRETETQDLRRRELLNEESATITSDQGLTTQGFFDKFLKILPGR